MKQNGSRLELGVLLQLLQVIELTAGVRLLIIGGLDILVDKEDHVQVLPDKIIVLHGLGVEQVDDLLVPLILADFYLLAESLDALLLTVVLQVLQDLIKVGEGSDNEADEEVLHHV